MAAPSTTVRVAPPGIKMEDGYPTTLAFARDPNVNFWEKSVKPPGIDGGEAIDQTTMHNATWRTMAPRKLKTLTPVSTKAAWDPACYNEISQLINKSGSITVRFPDGSTLDFYGYLKSFEPSEMSEGNQPEADITIVPTNFDPVNRVEAAPVLTEVTGT